MAIKQEVKDGKLILTTDKEKQTEYTIGDLQELRDELVDKQERTQATIDGLNALISQCQSSLTG